MHHLICDVEFPFDVVCPFVGCIFSANFHRGLVVTVSSHWELHPNDVLKYILDPQTVLCCVPQCHVFCLAS
jgi:hypothetical protein